MWAFPEESSLHTEAVGASPPDAFGPFRVLHQIGAGALGPVFRAYEPDRDRLVAVKLFRLDLPPERVHQLVAELEQVIAAELEHPAIATPRATGIDSVNAYLAQDYVVADSLDSVIRQNGPAPAADALRVAAQLADALDFAADRQIVHGALHPRDVLLSKDDLRLVGLGVTRALERVGGAAPVRRPYTAPERIGGGAWDRRADVFSLAAVMHELLWGRRLAATGARAAEILGELPGADVEKLRHVFAQALADDMADRFATATDFAEALAGAFDARPSPPLVASRRPGAAPRVEPRPLLAPRLPLNLDGGDEDRQPDLALHVPEPSAGDSEDGEERQQVDRLGQRDEPYQEADVAPPAPLVQVAEVEAAEPLVSRSFLSSSAPVESSSLSLVWPLALAGIVGAALGFGAGYAVAIRDRPSAAPAAAAASPVPPAGRDVAEGKAAEPGATLTQNAAQKPDAPQKPNATADATPGRPDAAHVATSRAASAASAPAPAAPALPVAAPFAGRVLVRSTPPGAHVFVDGRARGDTPATVRDLSRGEHQIRLVRDGYTTAERRIILSATRPAQSLLVPMAPALGAGKAAEAGRASRAGKAGERAPLATVGRSAIVPTAPVGTDGALVVESRPTGANVFIDGRLVGTTPLNLPHVPAGEHSVQIEQAGYRRWSSSMRVTANEQNRVTASLER